MRTMGMIGALLIGVSPAMASPPLFDSPARAFHTGDQIIEEAYRPHGMDVADLDGDGDIDVVLAQYGNFIDPKVSIHFNDGDGTLGPARKYDVPGETSDVVAADLDGDGDTDLAFSEYEPYDGARLFVLRNNGNGTFAAPTSQVIGRDPTRMIAADLNNDGALDLACTNQWVAERLVVLTNDGAAGFTVTNIPLAVGDGPFDVDAGDLDGDGWADLVVSLGETFSALAIIMNDGAGGFLAPQILSGPFGWPAVALADIDADDDLDIVLSTTLMRNRGDGTFDPAEPLPALPLYSFFSDVAVADVTGDGALDVLGVKLASDDAGWLLIESTGQPGEFAGAAQFRSGQYARAIDAADMDGDGDLDAVIANGNSLTVEVHRNDAGSFSMPYVDDTGSSLTHGLDAADLDLDGDLDAVAGSYDVYRHMNNGDGTFTAYEVETILGRKYDFELADVNGDAYPDMLFIRHPDSPPYNLYVNLNNGDGSFGPTTTWLLQSSCGTRDIETLDWDNDGDLDVAITDHLGCPGVGGVRLHLVENNGDGTFGPDNYLEDFTIPDTYRLVTGDFDADGHADIVTTQSETVAFWRGQGDGSFAVPAESDIDPQPTNERTPWYITSADFNGDDIPDIATANLGWTLRGENITVLLGNGNGTFEAAGLYYTMHAVALAGAGGIGTLDADADGDIDLVAGARYGSDIVLLRNDGNGSFQITDRYGVDGTPADLRTGDFDGDGITDVAAHIGYHFDGGVTVLRGLAAGGPTGDLNGDTVVDAADLALLLGTWGPCPGCAADLNGDGDVGAADLALLLGNWS